MFWHINIPHMPCQTYQERFIFMLLRCVQTIPPASAIRQLTPLRLGTCATKEARVRNQEPTGQANHFNKHRPTKQSTIFINWHPLFFIEWHLDMSEAKQFGLYDWSWYIKFSYAFMTKYNFPWIAVFESWTLTQGSIKILAQRRGGGKEHGLHCFLSVAWNQ